MVEAQERKVEAKELKKTKKKIQQAIGVISRTEERELNDFCCKEPSQTLFVAHFGNGDEAD
jgi:hypothetical protein